MVEECFVYKYTCVSVSNTHKLAIICYQILCKFEVNPNKEITSNGFTNTACVLDSLNV